MALTITTLVDSVAGNKRSNSGFLSLDASYPAAGYPVRPQLFGLSVIENLAINPRRGYLMHYDRVIQTVRVFQPNDIVLVGGQVPGNVVQVGAGNVLGKTAAGNVTAVSAAPVEVPTGTDLSTITNADWRAVGV